MSVTSRQLANGLRIHVITDPLARSAAALLQADAGSLHEPDAWPGLAHLLEHVLFAGSAAFRDDQRLMAWIPAQGGRLNATTRGDRTAFFFECAPALLAGGLARLADMLAAPLLAESAIAQEAAAIDAEYRLLCGHQETLADAALSAAFRAPHPWQRFQVGDAARFGADYAALGEALRQFHQRACRADNLTLWLQGPQPLAELWQLADAAVGQFPPAAARRPASPSDNQMPVMRSLSQATALPTPPLVFGDRRDFVLQRPDGESLRLSFLLASGFDAEIALLCQLLPDEAEGSLMAALRAAGLADALRVLRPYVSAGQTVLSVELTLAAPECAAQAEGLLHHWLHALARLSEASLRHYAALAARRFGQLSPMDQLRERAFGLVPPQAWPRWRALLAQLVPANMTRLRSGAEEVGALWPAQGFSLGLAARRLAAAVPPPAPEMAFFPRPATAAVREAGETVVPLPHSNGGDERAVLLLSPAYALPAPQGEMLQAVLRALAGSCLHRGGELRWERHQGRWLLQLHGAPELMVSTLAALNDRLAALPAAAAQGAREHRRQQRLRRGDIAVRALIAELPSLWLAQEEAQAPAAPLAQPWRASLYGGDEALRQRLARLLARFPAPVNPPEVAQHWLPQPQAAYVVATDSCEAALTLFCPRTVPTAAASAAWRCLALIYQPAFFQRLRVEQNIGYAVSCRFHPLAGQPGILFCLQSPTLSHDRLWACIEAFLAQMTAALAALTSAQLDEYRRALLAIVDDRSDDPLTASRERWLLQQDPAPPLDATAIGNLRLQDLQHHHQQLVSLRQHWWRLTN